MNDFNESRAQENSRLYGIELINDLRDSQIPKRRLKSPPHHNSNNNSRRASTPFNHNTNRSNNRHFNDSEMTTFPHPPHKHRLSSLNQTPSEAFYQPKRKPKYQEQQQQQFMPNIHQNKVRKNKL